MEPSTFQPSSDYLNALRTRLEGICRTVAPADLPAGRPFYIVWQSEIPTLAQADGTFFGLHVRSMDLIARQYIADRWQGRGAAILLGDATIAKWIQEVCRPLNEQAAQNWFEAHAFATTLHELAHAAEYGFTRGDAVPAAVLAMVNEAVHQCVAQTDPDEAEIEYDTLLHRPEWIRVSLHLFHRASVAGLWPAMLLPAPHSIADGWSYGLSDTGRYESALADEPQRRIGESLTDIIRSEPPAAFAALWDHDQKQRIKTPAGISPIA
jgi:hypothetical protein